jgi:hypothetical protein
MVYHNQNYWGFGLSPLPGIIGNRKHDISETRSVSVLRCWRGRHSIQSLSKGPNWVRRLPPKPEDGNKSSFRNVVFSVPYNTGQWRKSKNPVILILFLGSKEHDLRFPRWSVSELWWYGLTPCRTTRSYQHFGQTCCLQLLLSTLKMKIEESPETLIII